MKTLVKHLTIEFSLHYIDDGSFNIDMFENSSKFQNSYRLITNGFLVGKFNQIITNQIVFNN